MTSVNTLTELVSPVPLCDRSGDRERSLNEDWFSHWWLTRRTMAQTPVVLCQTMRMGAVISRQLSWKARQKAFESCERTHITFHTQEPRKHLENFSRYRRGLCFPSLGNVAENIYKKNRFHIAITSKVHPLFSV